MKPHYRIYVSIVDENTGEAVVTQSDALYSMNQETVQVAYRVLEAFHKKTKEFEAVHYPTNEEEHASDL